MRLLLALLAAALALGASRPASERLEIDVLFTSDIHGHIDRGRATFLSPEFPPPLGGGASAATYVTQVRTEARSAGRRVLLFDSGDLFSGTPLGAHTKGAAIIDWMNRMGYEAGVLGNHDFDLGRENAERLARRAEFPVLAGNLFDRATGERLSWVRGHVMIEVEGVRIAVLGYITESTVHMAFERNIAGLEFRPVVDVLEGDVQRVRAAGADLVFVLLHHGLPYRLEMEEEYRDLLEREAQGTIRHFGMSAMELAHVVKGVDVYFAGHTHQGYDRPWEDPVTHALVFQPFANGSSLGHATLLVDRGTRSLVGYRTHFDRGALLTLLEDEVWPDEAEAERLGRETAEAERGLAAMVGRTRRDLVSGGPENGLMGFLMADAYRVELGADFAIQNTGGVRGSIPSGPITERQLLEVSPFGNQMVVAKIPGAMLREMLEDKVRGRGEGVFISGGRVRYDPSRPDGARIVEFSIGGAPVDTARVYGVALSDYLAEGNSGLSRLRSLPPESFLPSGFTDREILSRYIERLGEIDLVNDGRWGRVQTP
jgi:2',3'-cyclic-nucleotide 2'-phosphodiesterase (5'-nucleotidase family)